MRKFLVATILILCAGRVHATQNFTNYIAGAPVTIYISSASAALLTGYQSNFVINTSTKALDDLIACRFQSPTSVVSTSTLTFYAYSSIDGTNYPDGVTGSSNTMTVPATPNSKYLGAIAMPSASTTFSAMFDLANAFGGSIPPYWGIWYVNWVGASITQGTCTYQAINVLNQ